MLPFIEHEPDLNNLPYVAICVVIYNAANAPLVLATLEGTVSLQQCDSMEVLEISKFGSRKVKSAQSASTEQSLAANHLFTPFSTKLPAHMNNHFACFQEKYPELFPRRIPQENSLEHPTDLFRSKTRDSRSFLQWNVMNPFEREGGGESAFVELCQKDSSQFAPLDNLVREVSRANIGSLKELADPITLLGKRIKAIESCYLLIFTSCALASQPQTESLRRSLPVQSLCAQIHCIPNIEIRNADSSINQMFREVETLCKLHAAAIPFSSLYFLASALSLVLKKMFDLFNLVQQNISKPRTLFRRAKNKKDSSISLSSDGQDLLVAAKNAQQACYEILGKFWNISSSLTDLMRQFLAGAAIGLMLPFATLPSSATIVKTMHDKLHPCSISRSGCELCIQMAHDLARASSTGFQANMLRSMFLLPEVAINHEGDFSSTQILSCLLPVPPSVSDAFILQAAGASNILRNSSTLQIMSSCFDETNSEQVVNLLYNIDILIAIFIGLFQKSTYICFSTFELNAGLEVRPHAVSL